MTRVRKLAEGISKWVCRNAPPVAKDWGAASERELGHIENDWEALRWAAGSTTMLLAGRRFAPPIASVEQVPALAKCMERLVWRRTVLCTTVVALQVYGWTHFFTSMHGWVQQAGCCLILAAMAIFAVQGYLRRWRGMPRGAAGAQLIAPLREELVRQREFHSGGWLAARLYSLMPGFLLICCGAWNNERTIENAGIAFGLAALFAVAATVGTMRQLRTAEGFQRQIDALDALDEGAKV